MNQCSQVETGFIPCLGRKGSYILRGRGRDQELGCYPRKEAGRASKVALGLHPLCRSALESIPDLTTLGEKEARLLLAALVQDYVQMKASDLEQETGASR